MLAHNVDQSFQKIIAKGFNMKISGLKSNSREEFLSLKLVQAISDFMENNHFTDEEEIDFDYIDRYNWCISNSMDFIEFFYIECVNKLLK